MSQIKFGTDGWRAVMAREFTFDNVRIVAQAIADFVTARRATGRGMVIGYDNRFLSEHFARAVAEVLVGNDIAVLMPEKALPTPVTAYSIKMTKTAGAVMITASHNPPEYNGIKFIPEYAGPALPEITDEIEANVRRLEEGAEIKETPLAEAEKKGLVTPIDPFRPYLEHLGTLVDLEAVRRSRLKVVVDPLFGAGVGYLERVLEEAGCEVQVIHGHRDPLFGGDLPEPSDRVLGELKEKVRTQKAHLGLALDGDADRFGVIDGNGEFINANQVLSLLFHHLLERRGLRGPVARSVATTHMLDRIAGWYGVGVEETPVGFKYIGQSLLERGSVLGGEESGGLSIKGHVPEKDGILAAALVAEMVATWGSSLTEALSELETQFGRIANERMDIHCTPKDKERVLGMFPIWRPNQLGGLNVVDKITVDGCKFLLSDGSWALLRPSGTEPLFRLYVETFDRENLRRIQGEVRGCLGL
jgi:alpha-D-glucose phosphate-specific phosphoglucomutase